MPDREARDTHKRIPGGRMLGSTVTACPKREVLLELTEVRKEFASSRGLLAKLAGRRQAFNALDDVSLTIHRQEVVGLVGESGCGKSTLAHVAIRLLDVDSGSLAYKGNGVKRSTATAPRPLRRRVQ